ncbi:MAG: hypothetical protein JNM76_02525 [Betaproteobacteria bacterium]|nr:hypothetical protein [Betaproteobacteria bacterium]
MRIVPITALVCALLASSTPALANHTINFTVQLSISKLDPKVTELGLHCIVGSKDPIATPADILASSGQNPPAAKVSIGPTAGYTGPLSVPVTIPTDKMSQAVKWQCGVQVKGPGGVWENFGAIGVPDWAKKSPSSSANSVGGKL